MSNIRLVLHIQGIRGAILRPAGKRRVKQIIAGKKGVHVKWISEQVRTEVPASKTIKMSQEAYEWFTQGERPEWYYKKGWKSLKPEEKLKIHLDRICQAEGGTDYTYSILNEENE